MLLLHPSVLEHVEQKKKTESSVIEVIEVKEREVKTAKVAFDSEGLKAMGVKKGDIVGILKNSDYPFNIDGEKLYRTRMQDLMYIEA